MKKVIVTGANGFIGSHLTNFLSRKGIKVYAVVRNEDWDTLRLYSNSNVEIVRCDLDDIQSLPSLINDRDIDVFYHFGWGGVSGAQRRSYVSQIRNIEYSCTSAEVCSKMNCKTFVFASSIREYECLKMMSSLEQVDPSAVYASAKIAANFMTRTLCNSHGIKYISGVITNVYGPGESSPRLINSTIRKMLNREETEFTSGTQTYDFIYIDDAIEAFYKLGFMGNNNKAYYIGSLNPRPLVDFLKTLRDCIDSSIPLGVGVLPDGTHLDYKVFDINAVSLDTGFEPRVPFSDGIMRTIEWIKSKEGEVS